MFWVQDCQTVIDTYKSFREELVEEFNEAAKKTRDYYERIGNVNGKYIKEYNDVIAGYCPKLEVVAFNSMYLQLFEMGVKNIKLIRNDIIECDRILKCFNDLLEHYKKNWQE